MEKQLQAAEIAEQGGEGGQPEVTEVTPPPMLPDAQTPYSAHEVETPAPTLPDESATESPTHTPLQGKVSRILNSRVEIFPKCYRLIREIFHDDCTVFLYHIF